jgi:hypothetical protein
VLPGRVIVIGHVDDGSRAERSKAFLSALSARDLGRGPADGIGFGIHGCSAWWRVVARGEKVIGKLGESGSRWRREGEEEAGNQKEGALEGIK